MNNWRNWIPQDINDAVSGLPFFQNLAQQNHQPQHQPQRPSVAPPASKRLLRNLPTVRVTSDDLIEETNKNCCICLDDHSIGDTAVKLPCGHIYHPTCLVGRYALLL